MHQFMHIPAKQFLAVETKGTYSHSIDEGTVPFQIQTPDPLTGRVQQRLPMLHLPFGSCHRHRHLVHFHLQSR